MKIVYYETENGDCPLSDYLDSLNPKLLAKTLRTIDLLEKKWFISKIAIFRIFKR